MVSSKVGLFKTKRSSMYLIVLLNHLALIILVLIKFFMYLLLIIKEKEVGQ